MLTYRQLINTTDHNKVLDLLINKHALTNNTKIFKLRSAYQNVINRLKKYKKSIPKCPIALTYIPKNKFGGDYIAVHYINPNYIKPPKNISTAEYQKYFAFGLDNWSTLIDCEIILENKKVQKLISTPEHILAELLWETTFYGFTPKETNGLKKSLIEAAKEIKKKYK